MFGPCFVIIQYLMCCNHLGVEEERAGCFILLVFPMSCDCCDSVVLVHDAMGLYAVCECGTS